MILEKVFRKTVKMLEKHDFQYLIIGGIAAGAIGEPRATGDIDINIHIKKNLLKKFLGYAQTAGFTFDKNELSSRVKETGTFQIWCGDFHVDFLISSTKFEESALKRKQRIRIFGVEANFPTAEDLILFKVVPARYIDLADAENIAIRHKGKLDEKYLLDWAKKLSDEAEDMRIFQEVKKLLK